MLSESEIELIRVAQERLDALLNEAAEVIGCPLSEGNSSCFSCYMKKSRQDNYSSIGETDPTVILGQAYFFKKIISAAMDQRHIERFKTAVSLSAADKEPISRFVIGMVSFIATRAGQATAIQAAKGDQQKYQKFLATLQPGGWFERGRAIANKRKQDEALANKKSIETAVLDLLKNFPQSGDMSNPQLAKWLHGKQIGKNYKEASLAKMIGRIRKDMGQA